ncbi:MAG TPA: ParM/StbA family protein [Candidatus Lokiarchaeia archaeon]|nr:ParM/StbA family protein [Candidatus Lokiarchaeia archaeon]
MTLKFAGMDLGTSTLKTSFENGTKKYKMISMLGDVNEGWTGMSVDKSWINNLVIKHEDKEYFVGELARTQSEIKYALVSEGRMKSAENAFIALKSSLTNVAEDGDEFIIGVGVPVATSMNEMKELSRLLKGSHEIDARNDATGEEKHMTVEVKKCQVIPEPYGTYYWTLKQRNVDVAIDAVIIDIGHGSTDYLAMYQGRPMRQSSGSLNEAVDTLTSRISKKLNDQTGKYIRPYELMKAIELGRDAVMVGGETFSIKEIKEYYAEQIAKIMVDETERLISFMPPDAFVELYVCTGGGAYTFGSYIQQALANMKMIAAPEDCVIPEDPVMSNAMGFELVVRDRAEEKDTE